MSPKTVHGEKINYEEDNFCNYIFSDVSNSSLFNKGKENFKRKFS